MNEEKRSMVNEARQFIIAPAAAVRAPDASSLSIISTLFISQKSLSYVVITVRRSLLLGWDTSAA
jgi:hypothetical protein